METTLPLLALAVAAIVTIIMTEGQFTLWESMIGLILISIEVGESGKDFPGFWHEAAFSGIIGLSVLITLGFAIDRLFFEWQEIEDQEYPLCTTGRKREITFFVIWAVLTVASFLVRRAIIS